MTVMRLRHVQRPRADQIGNERADVDDALRVIAEVFFGKQIAVFVLQHQGVTGASRKNRSTLLHKVN